MAKDKPAGSSEGGNAKYGSEFIQDVKAVDVKPTLDNRKKKYGDRYLKDSIIPESDGEFTILIIFKLP